MRVLYQPNRRLPISRGTTACAAVYVLRREPLYHKLQYSKVPKFDAAAAAFGVIVGAFAVYLCLSSLGSAGADLTDLTCVCWYVLLWLVATRALISSLREGGVSFFGLPHLLVLAGNELVLALSRTTRCLALGVLCLVLIGCLGGVI
jgi:hypothetical protein